MHARLARVRREGGIPIAAGALYPFFGLLLSPMVAAAAMREHIVKATPLKVAFEGGIELLGYELQAKAKVTTRSDKGTIFMNFHFPEAAVNLLTNPVLDPVAKIPEFKVCAVRLEAVEA